MIENAAALPSLPLPLTAQAGHPHELANAHWELTRPETALAPSDSGESGSAPDRR
jgi:hypothetical protein